MLQQLKNKITTNAVKLMQRLPWFIPSRRGLESVVQCTAGPRRRKELRHSRAICRYCGKLKM